jgi:hypothetical protein
MITVRFKGDRELKARVERIPARAHDKLRARITDLADRLEARVRAAEPVKTGQLRGATLPSVKETPHKIEGKVRVSRLTKKAAALEYGAHGGAHVRAHDARLNHIFGRLVAPMTVQVQAYQRRVNIAEHRFLLGPFEAMKDEIIAELRDAMEEAL